MEWLFNASVVGALLVFLGGLAKLLNERTAIKRLRELVEIQNASKDLFKDEKTSAAVESAILSLAKKVERKEAGKSGDAIIVGAATALVLIGLVALAVFAELFRSKVEITPLMSLPLVLGGVLGVVGLLLALVYGIAQIIDTFKEFKEWLRKKGWMKREDELALDAQTVEPDSSEG